jgi:hypothetical protein
MARKIEDLPILDDMSVRQALEPGKVVVIILDGVQGKVKKCEAVPHGQTVIETSNGKTKRISFKDEELF